MPQLRLDKFLADSGLGTRSEVKQLIKKGRVTVNGKKLSDSSAKIDTAYEICVDGNPINYSKFIYLMLNKPSGVISATHDIKEKTVIDLLKPPYSNMELFPVGRLDKDTVGLLILTNDGAFAHNTLSPKKHIPKTYYVEAEGHFPSDIAIHFNKGITLKEGYECKSACLDILSITDSNIKAYLTITEGKFHQIKRMFEAEGGTVTHLKRVAFGKISLDATLKEGSYRALNYDELAYAASLKQEY